MKLNLQLFALNTGTSIVDYLKSQGQDSSYSARKKLAKQYGITNYGGTEDQNIALLNALKSGSKGSTTTTTTTTTTPTTTPVTTPTTQTKTPIVSNVQGVDKGITDALASGWNGLSSSGQAAQDEADSLRDNYLNLSSKPYKNEAYDNAMAFLETQKQQIQSGKTKYTDQLESLMSQITNRDKFTYDMDTDTMFQQYLSSMMRNGASAMQDTMGQASMLTGGYGSSYATSAANQAYNAYIEDAYANLPDYYNMALNAYQMEGEELYKQFSMYSDADEKEYARLLDSYKIGWDEAMHIYDKGYTEYQDSITNAFNAMNVAQGEADRLYKNEWDAYLDEQNRLSNLATLQNSDYWSNQEMELKKDQFDLEKDQFKYEKDQAAIEYDRWFAEHDLDGDGVVDDDDTELKVPTQAQKQKALEAYNESGESGYYAYLDSLPSNIDVEEIDLYVNGNGKGKEEDGYVKGYGELPISQRTWTVVEDGGFNWLGGVDRNVVVKDQYGNKMRLSELMKQDKSLAKKLSGLKKGESYTAK